MQPGRLFTFTKPRNLLVSLKQLRQIYSEPMHSSRCFTEDRWDRKADDHDFTDVVPSLYSFDRLAEMFVSSYEATLFRLATSHPGLSVAGRLVYRYRKGEAQRMKGASQLGLFVETGSGKTTPKPKYRRQSLHLSTSCGQSYSVPYNKSFEQNSCVYSAKDAREIVTAFESLPNRSGEVGSIQCVRAPYQRPGLDDEFPDVLFLWWK